MSRTMLTRWRPSVATIGLLLIGGVLAASQAPGHGVPVGGPSQGLWLSDSPLDDGRRLLIVVDPATRHAAVYHVDAASGGLALKSARDLTWDLGLDEFNVQEPRPAALRKMLETPAPRGP
jgi:hypothetical protein